MTTVRGVGWVRGRAWGCVRLRMERQAPSETDLAAAWRGSGILGSPARNFARLDDAAQRTCFAGALALHDAGEPYGNGAKRDVALLGTSECGSLAENEKYFRDYISCGRTLARGALFVYTLPSSGLAEAAIHLGFQGPLLYMGGGRGSTGHLLQTAATMIEEHETEAALVVGAGPTHAIGFYLRSGPPDTPPPGAFASCAAQAAGDMQSLLKRLGEML